MGITIDNKEAQKYSKCLYSAGKTWYVICPDCHKVITKVRKYENDIKLGLTDDLREWAELEYQRHERREHNDS